MILGLLALSAVSAAICFGVYTWIKRSEAPPAAEQSAPEPTGAPQGKTARAVVSLPAGQPKAVIRQDHAFDASVVLLIPTGTAVEVLNSTSAGGQNWCRVRTIDHQPAASGWMHCSILKYQ